MNDDLVATVSKAISSKDTIERICLTLLSQSGSTTMQALTKALGFSASQLAEHVSAVEVALSAVGCALIIAEEQWSVRPSARHLKHFSESKILTNDLTPATSEVVGILLYAGELTRAGLERIRGVQSTTLLRQLVGRGLLNVRIEKGEQQYSISAETLAHLRITKAPDAPEYATLSEQFKSYERT
jgi:chromosome segregation and condensation protein ScpB